MTESNVFQQQEQKKLEQISKATGQDIMSELVSLPSNGLVYPLEHAFSNCETIEIKPLTAHEEDLLTSRSLIKNGTVISKLLQSCIINKSVDPDTLLVGDRNSALIAIRVSGYGSAYNCDIECPECDEKFNHSFDLSKLEVKRLGIQPLQQNVNLFEYVLPLSGMKVQFKLLTGQDETAISKQLEATHKATKSLVENSVTTRLFYSILSINGETDKSKIQRMINNLRAMDSMGFRKYVESIEPGVKMEQAVKCPQCEVESEVSIPLGIGFLYPNIK